MFDNSGSSVTLVRAWVDELPGLDGADLTDAERIDLLTVLEELKSAAAAAQARVTVAFDDAQREQCSTEAEARECRRSVAAQVALARHESPHAGNRHLGVARALVAEMPHTMAALTTGVISEWRAHLMVRETSTLTREDRQAVDVELAGRLGGMGNRQVAAEARAIGYRLDPTSLLRRTRGAEGDRRVTVRPAPDTMTYLTGFLPVAQGVAVHTALRRHAESLHAQGDPRTVAQIMADTLVARCTGREQATGTPVEVQLVMSDRTLLDDDPEPARLVGYGPVPAWVGRRLVREAEHAWVRRLFRAPGSGTLVAMDSRRRRFGGRLRQFLVIRDDACRTPWCDAPIRHLDHPVPVARDGGTSRDNGQGLCESCNYVKEAPGWAASVDGDVVTTTTPTGHRHTTRPPPVVAARVNIGASARLDAFVREQTAA